MATDYVVFIHGVNTRDEREKPEYANRFFSIIQQEVEAANPQLSLKSVPLYWGDVGGDNEHDLLSMMKQPSRGEDLWDKLWFQEFREKQLLQFAGDAALYISRSIGSKVVDRIAEQANKALQGFKPNDRLHLVTHSWGTVILFDILFAARWDEKNIPGYPNAKIIRDCVFGVEPNPLQGLSLSSIYTMGSPVSLFSLMDATQISNSNNITNTHDITPRLEELLVNLYKKLDRKLLWKNFIHPGDPVAYPLANLMTQIVDRDSKYLDIKDIVLHNQDLLDFLTMPASQTVLALIHGGDAHSSYWKSQDVAHSIANSICHSARQPVA